jgi:two-component system response regulator AtoC
LPPLRERREDIPMLAHHFLQKCSSGTAQVIRGFVAETTALLQEYEWPGNVRELENAIERAVSLAHGPLIFPTDLPQEIRNKTPRPFGREARSSDFPEELVSLEEMEKRYLTWVLQATDGNKVKAAKILGIDRRTLYRMAERFGLELGESGE